MKKLLFATAVSLTALASWAVPAKPGLTERMQADGTTVSVRLHGDEHSHFILSEDGYPLVESNGFLFFAQVDADGNATPSPYRATSVGARDAATKAFLSGIDAEKAAASMARHATAAGDRQRAAKRGPGLCTTTFPGKGDQKGLVILVSYADVDFRLADAHDYFSNLLNEPGFSRSNATGSARDYFMDCSDGQFRPTFDVYGPVKLPQKMQYYGANVGGSDYRPHMMAIHACEMLDSEIDFREYDRDGDGVIDNVFIFYAGLGEASGGGADTVWPHSWDVRAGDATNHVFDGVTLGHYACTNEWTGSMPDGIGTFCHEFSHVMGLPDLYATSYTTAFTPGEWNVLDYGPYNNNGRTPPLYSAFERYAMDWMKPIDISGPANIALPPISSNVAYIIRTQQDNEYFLLENRQKTSWDTYIPGHGMLIWHIDYNRSQWDRNTVNNNALHQYVDIEEADNTRNASTRAGDAFPGSSNVTSFTDDTAPSMRTWSGARLALPLTDIAETNGMITFKVAGGLEESAPTEGKEVNSRTISSTGFRADWDEVEGAEYYELHVYRDISVRSAAGQYRAPLAATINTGTATNWFVEDLLPDTPYAFVVFVKQKDKGLSKASNEVKVRTLPAPFSSLRPDVYTATQVGEQGFMANWPALNRATDYLLTVGQLSASTCRLDLVDFTGGVSALPAGWTSSTNLTFTEEDFCGESAPALRLTNSNDYIQSPEYSSDIVSLKFWQRGPAESAPNKIEVRWFVGGNWVYPLVYDVATNTAGEMIKLTEVPSGAKAVRIAYLPEEGVRSSVAIDDIIVGWDAEYESTPLPQYTDLSSNGALKLRVEGLKPGSRYGYTITATDGQERTQPSKMIVVNTLGNPYQAGVETVGTSASGITLSNREAHVGAARPGDVKVYDATGRRAACAIEADGDGVRIRFFSPGLYVITGPNGALKAIVK